MEGSDVYANITCLVYSYNGTGWLTFFFSYFAVDSCCFKISCETIQTNTEKTNFYSLPQEIGPETVVIADTKWLFQ